jgi:hypothetical protein
MAENGRGLAIVAALADEVGQACPPGHTRVSWACLSW